MADPDTTDGCDARITGEQREALAAVMCVLRMHRDPLVQGEAARLADIVVALYDQIDDDPHIKELEAKLTEVRNDLRDGCLGQREIDALLEKGASRKPTTAPADVTAAGRSGHPLAALRPGVEILAGLVFDHGRDRIAVCTEIAYLEREETEPVRAVLAWLRASKEADKAAGG